MKISHKRESYSLIKILLLILTYTLLIAPGFPQDQGSKERAAVSPRDQLNSLTHDTGTLSLWVQDNGDLAIDCWSLQGEGIIWNDDPLGTAAFFGGPLWGTEAVGKVNGNRAIFDCWDIQTSSSTFSMGFTSDANFNEISYCVVNDNGSTDPGPYGIDAEQYVYSSTGDNFVFIRYGYVNRTLVDLVEFYGGVFLDWDIFPNWDRNLGDYDLNRKLLYQFEEFDPDTYVGVAVLSEFSGGKLSTGLGDKEEAFEHLKNLDTTLEPAGDYRTWIGTGPFTLTANRADTIWATFAIIGGSTLEEFFANADAAISKGLSIWYALGDLNDPKPPHTFKAYSDFMSPYVMHLSWEDPVEYINGDLLVDFDIVISRDGVVVDFVSQGTQSYLDVNLTDGQLYEYEIWARDASDSASASASASWIAGGSPTPIPPSEFFITQSGLELTMHWTNPAVNIDGTPMDDLAGIKLYEDGFPVATFIRSTVDSARTDSQVYVSPIGPHEYYLTALDNEIPQNESLSTDTVTTPFSGIIDSLSLRIETQIASPGDTVTLPLHVEIPSGLAYNSFELSIGGFQEDVEFNRIASEGTLPGDNGWIIEFNDTDSLLFIASAGADSISGAGVLLFLEFLVPASADSGFVSIDFEMALFDVFHIPGGLEGGSIRVLILTPGDVDMNGFISDNDSQVLLDYLAKSVTFDTLQILNGNVSSDSTLSGLDASFILQFVGGILDTLPTDNLAPASGQISMQGGMIEPGETIEIPIIVSGSDSILGFSGTVTYNPSVLAYGGITLPAVLDSFQVSATSEVSGKIHFAGASRSTPLADGTMLTLQFGLGINLSVDSTVILLKALRWNEEEVEFDVASALVKFPHIVSIDVPDALPEKFDLIQNYPNPFNSWTAIPYAVPSQSEIKLTIFDISGRHVKTLVTGSQPPGWYQVDWNGTNDFGNVVGSGVYLIKFTSTDNLSVKKALFVK